MVCQKEGRLHTKVRRTAQISADFDVNVDGGVAATPAGSNAALKRKRWLCANCRKSGQRSATSGGRLTKSDKQTSKQTVSEQTKQQTVRTVLAYPVINKGVEKGVDGKQHKVVAWYKSQKPSSGQAKQFQLGQHWKVCYSFWIFVLLLLGKLQLHKFMPPPLLLFTWYSPVVFCPFHFTSASLQLCTLPRVSYVFDTVHRTRKRNFLFACVLFSSTCFSLLLLVLHPLPHSSLLLF